VHHGQKAPETEQIGVPAAGRYRLDPAFSSVTFRTRHLFGLAGVKGTVPIVGGDIVLDPAVLEADVTVTLDVAAISTGNTRRDRDVGKPKFPERRPLPGDDVPGAGPEP
jgi:polyisoprenoid-binding protein YceI